MPETTERIGKFDVRVECCEPTRESQPLEDRRIAALAAWLLGCWDAERKEREHGESRAAS